MAVPGNRVWLAIKFCAGWGWCAHRSVDFDFRGRG